MRTKVFDGFMYQRVLLQSLRQQVQAMDQRPCVGVIRLGESLASARYIQRKREAVIQAGMNLVEFPVDSQRPKIYHYLQGLIEDMNRSKDIHGIIVQLPLPQLDPQPFLNKVLLEKDIDGLSYRSNQNMIKGQGLFYTQCAVQGVVQIIQDLAGTEWKKKKVAVLGKGLMIGAPLHALLKYHYALPHLHWIDKDTQNKDQIILQCEVIVLCTGQPQVYGRESFRKGAVVVDTGVYKAPCIDQESQDQMSFYGDLRVDGLEGWLGGYSPVPGGVGPLCVANVAANLLRAYKVQHHLVE